MTSSKQRSLLAILYYRVSPRPNLDESESIPAQQRTCHEYCQRHGYRIEAEYSDSGRSGSDDERPGLWDAIAAVRRGYVLVVRWQNRLARDVYLEEVIYRTVQNAGGRIEAVEGSSNGTDPDAVFLRQVFAAIHERERKITAIRTRQAMARHQEAGRRMSDRLPYGRREINDRTITHADGTTKTIRMMEDDPNEQQNIRRICELHRAGKGLRAICRAMQAANIPYRDRTTWHHNSVRSILERAGMLERISTSKEKGLGMPYLSNSRSIRR